MKKFVNKVIKDVEEINGVTVPIEILDGVECKPLSPEDEIKLGNMTFKDGMYFPREDTVIEPCKYCYEIDNKIFGDTIHTYELKETAGYKERKGSEFNKTQNEYLNLFILKGKDDKKAGLMIENIVGARYIDITYCPFCGRKLDNHE